MAAYDVADRESTAADDDYMVWVLNSQMDEMDRAAAAAAPAAPEEQLVEFDGVLYRQAFQSPQVMQTPRPSPASVPQAVAGRYGCQTGGAAGNLQDSRQTKARANTVARRSEDRAEVAIERLRRLREARQVASIRDGYAGTPPSRASVCYYDGECEKLDGGALCPECLDVCTYQLKCPGCEAKACRRCQKAASLRFPHNRGKMARTELMKGRGY
jgi:hypothetical protein